MQRVAAAGGRVLAICGGMQMLGRRLGTRAAGERDRDGPRAAPARDDVRAIKRVGCVAGTFRRTARAVGVLSGLPARGYEIRHGPASPWTASAPAEALPDGLGFAADPVLGVYLHGLFEDPEIVRALLGVRAAASSSSRRSTSSTDAVRPHLDLDAIDALAGVGA